MTNKMKNKFLLIYFYQKKKKKIKLTKFINGKTLCL